MQYRYQRTPDKNPTAAPNVNPIRKVLLEALSLLLKPISPIIFSGTNPTPTYFINLPSLLNISETTTPVENEVRTDSSVVSNF